MKNLLALLILLFGLSCQNQKTENPSSAHTAPVVKQPVAAQFEMLPNDMIMKLWNECTLIDYIFHTLPFSMNQSEQASIRTNLTYIGQTVQPNIPPGCKPMARQFYQINGEFVCEADVYYDDKCQFYVFYVGDKKYANVMSPDGQSFFNTMISKAMNARQQMSN